MVGIDTGGRFAAMANQKSRRNEAMLGDPSGPMGAHLPARHAGNAVAAGVRAHPESAVRLRVGNALIVETLLQGEFAGGGGGGSGHRILTLTWTPMADLDTNMSEVARRYLIWSLEVQAQLARCRPERGRRSYDCGRNEEALPRD